MREGWVCPKCGAPNNPDNKTCSACFCPPLPFPYPSAPPGDIFPNKLNHFEPCPKCGGPGYPLCPDFHCPKRGSIQYKVTCQTQGDEL
jgi:hypothetical protein